VGLLLGITIMAINQQKRVWILQYWLCDWIEDRVKMAFVHLSKVLRSISYQDRLPEKATKAGRRSRLPKPATRAGPCKAHAHSVTMELGLSGSFQVISKHVYETWPVIV
jgi:hypothetical protein